jgi:leucyl aminopeptidase
VPTLSLTTSAATSLKVDALVVGVAKGPRGLVLAPGSEAVAEALGRPLAATLAGLGATGKAEEVTRVATLGAMTPKVLVAVGLGTAPDPDVAYDLEVLRRAAGAAARALAGTGKAAFALLDPEDADPAAVRAVAEGALLGAYVFTRYRSADAGLQAPLREVSLVVDKAVARDRDVKDAVHRAEVVSAAVALARDLVNTPPSDLHPAELAEVAQREARRTGVKVEVLDAKALVKGGFGGITGVGQGSVNTPRLVHLSYKGGGRKVALIGKGITFDSGGLSLKPAAAMEEMKGDMGGAAAVIAAVAAAAELKLAVDVEAWIPMAENMPSGTAIRPSDVLTMRGGKTVEVNNTDAEGRLILADAIVRACEDGPEVLLDAATLTGAQLVSLGARTPASWATTTPCATPSSTPRAAPVSPCGRCRCPRTCARAGQRRRRPGQHRAARGRDAHRRAVPAGVRRRRRALGAPGHRRSRPTTRARPTATPGTAAPGGRAHLRAGARGPHPFSSAARLSRLPMLGRSVDAPPEAPPCSTPSSRCSPPS